MAAELAWDGYVLHEAPNADSWDAITSLVRRRAAKALELSLDVDTARAEREEIAPRGPSGGGVKTALRETDHRLVQDGSKWRCEACDQRVQASALVEFCGTTCSPPPPTAQTPSANSAPRTVGEGRSKGLSGRPLHESHRLGEWPKFCMIFYHECGRFATEDFRHLEVQCAGKSRKGAENLSRIGRCLYPRREGPPKSVREDMHGRVCAEEVAKVPCAGLGPLGAPPSAVPAPTVEGASESEATSSQTCFTVSELSGELTGSREFSGECDDPDEEAARWLGLGAEATLPPGPEGSMQ